MKKAMILMLVTMVLSGCNSKELPFGLKTTMGVMEITNTVGNIVFVEGTEDSYSFTPKENLMPYIDSYCVWIKKNIGFNGVSLSGNITDKDMFEYMEYIKYLVKEISSKFGNVTKRIERGDTVSYVWSSDEDGSIYVNLTTFHVMDQMYSLSIVYAFN